MNYSPADPMNGSQTYLLIAAVVPGHGLPDAFAPAWLSRARRAGMNAVVEPILPDPDAQEAFHALCAENGLYVVSPTDAAALPKVTTAADAFRAIADGATGLRFVDLLDADGQPTSTFFAVRPAAVFLETFREIILRGKREPNLKAARGGLIAHETRTAQAGSIVWIENPDSEKTLTGSVFPYLPEITLAPRSVFPYVHDTPIGGGASYLGSYAGLVKSDAPVLTAHILPDPHDGIRVYVYGEPGATHEVAVWSGNERGSGVDITFARVAPQVYGAGMSQIIALPKALAGRVWRHPTDDNAPVLIGPDDVPEHDAETATVELPSGKSHTLYALRPDGALVEINVQTPAPALVAPDFDDSDWREIDDIAFGGSALGTGWYRARLHLPAGTGGDAQIYFGPSPTPSVPRALYLNGERIAPGTSDMRLNDGDNLLCLFWDDATATFGPVTVVPSGGCYLMDISHWRFLPANREGSATVTIAL